MRLFQFLKTLMKTRNLLLLSLLIGICASCSQQRCRIEGVVENAGDGDTLFITQLQDGNFVPTDTILVKDGKFQLDKRCDSTIIACYYYLNGQNDEIYSSNIFFIEKGNVKIEIGLDSKVSGTENNNIYQQMTDSMHAIHAQLDRIYSELALTDSVEDFMPDQKVEEQLIALDSQSNRLIMENIRLHIDKPVGYLLFLSCYNMFTPEEVLELTDKLQESYKNSDIVHYIREEAQNSMAISEGQPFADITLPAMDGGELELSDVIKANKLTLVDCWASWCGPCRREMPSVVELYGKYHDKGLEIVGISFDEDEAAWKKAVKEMGMTWLQASELKGWDNIMTRQYGVTSIPYTILIDSNGTIIGQQLRGKDLEKKIGEYLD